MSHSPEPWHIHDDQLFDANGNVVEEHDDLKRIALCVNALADIPDDFLAQWGVWMRQQVSTACLAQQFAVASVAPDGPFAGNDKSDTISRSMRPESP